MRPKSAVADFGHACFCKPGPIGLLTSAGMTDLIEPAAREVLPENPHVLAVGAPRDVKRIADDRHGADQAVHRDIRDHARNDVGAGAELMRLVDDP